MSTLLDFLGTVKAAPHECIIIMATNQSPSLPIPVGLNLLFLNFDSKI